MSSFRVSIMDTNSCIRYCFRQSREPLPKKPKRDQHIKLVLFDMDGVLVDSISSWKHVHTYFSTSNDHSVDAYVKGLITDEEFIRQDVSQWKKDNEFIFLEELHDIFSSLSLINGARTCVNRLKKDGVMLGIVSAGIDLLANQVASELGITMVYANQLQTDKLGRLTGEGLVNVPLMYKDRVVKQISQRLHIPFGSSAAIGNSCFDIPLLRSVGLGIAFNPHDDCVVKEADEVVFEKNLECVLSFVSPDFSNRC